MDSFISRESDYAVRILVYLAESGTMRKAEEISAAIDVPKPTVAKVINRLKKADFILTRTGKHGGIAITHSALNASLYDILKCMGATLDINVCSSHPSACSRSSFCRVTHKFGEIQTSMADKLKNAKVKDFI